MNFIQVYRSEWLKKNGSMAVWLMLAGAFFVPMINTLLFIFYPERLIPAYDTPTEFWMILFTRSWNSMVVLFLPLGLVLVNSMLCQIEYKNNTWKQIHATPIPYTTIYFAKLSVILVMLVQLFFLFNVGIYASAVIPSFFRTELHVPYYPIPVKQILNENLNYFFVALPMLLLQFMLSMHFRNFVIPLGVGLVMVVLGITAISWEHHYLIPSLYPFLYHLAANQSTTQTFQVFQWASFTSLSFLLLGFLLYRFKPNKG
ncbi:MAG TPA: ABC transporter permease [Sphingobacteriaceae bacterium]|nr:ABC transporter permease [Sphingobacteriaceae bacterium]